MYKVLDVAHYIINRYNNKEWIISNLKLQKILYFVQAEFFASKNKECFLEDIEAWEFGPVIPEVYYKYEVYGAGHIPSSKNEIEESEITKDDQEIINGIADQCAAYSASTLTELTKKQMPWIYAYNDWMLSHSWLDSKRVISKESFREYFGEN